MSGIFAKIKATIHDFLYTKENSNNNDEYYYEDEYDDYEEIKKPRLTLITSSTRQKQPPSYTTPFVHPSNNVMTLLPSITENIGRSQEAHIYHPKDMSDTILISKSIREGKLCLVNIANLDSDVLTRIINRLNDACDSIGGVSYPIQGQLLCYAPHNVAITAADTSIVSSSVCLFEDAETSSKIKCGRAGVL